MANHTQTGSISFEATSAASLRADGQYESLSDNLRDNYYTKSEFTVAPDKILSTVKEHSEQSARPNLSPFFNVPKSDAYNATDNPEGYWLVSWSIRDCTTWLGDGWAHFEYTNTASGNTYPTFYEGCEWRKAHGSLKGDTVYTVLVELRNVVKTGTVTVAGISAHNTSNPSMFETTPGTKVAENGSLYFTGKTIANPDERTGYQTSTRTLFTMYPNSSISCDLRVSLYEGKYSGPYKPYVDQSLITRVSTAETAIEQNAENILLRATKTEAQQMAQPNLSPWFSLQPIENDTEHWNINNGNTTFTPLEDGWVHLHNDNSSGTGVKRTDYQVMGSPSVTPGADYTWLFEYRNNNSTGNNQNYIVQSSERVQFWGNNVVKVLEGKSGGATTTLGPNQDFPPGTDGVYVKRVLKKAEAATSSHLDKTGTLYLGCLVCYAYAGSVADYDLRVSIYEGEYTGPYKPYSGTQLYASQAQLKVANDEIDLRVEKSGVIAAINASTEAEGGSAVKIQADKVNIEGAAIFTSGRLSSTSLNNAYDAKGAASAVQDNLNNLQVGGRNLLRRTATPFSYAINTTNYGTHHLYSTGSTDTAYDGPMLSDFGLAVGDEVTFTFDWETSQNGSTAIRYGSFRIEYYGEKSDGTDGYITRMGNVVTMSESNASGRFSRTATLTAATIKTQRMVVRVDNSALVFSVSNAKLEIGNKATDWSPAPEDVTSRTQRIYYRTSSSAAPTSQYMPTAWVTETGDKWAANSTTVANWTAKATKLTNGSGTKYPYLFTCEQRQMGDGTLAYTTVLLDETTTVIDGGTIITHSVTANEIDATDLYVKSANIDGLLKAEQIDVENLKVPFSNFTDGDEDYSDLKSTIDGINAGYQAGDEVLQSAIDELSGSLDGYESKSDAEIAHAALSADIAAASATATAAKNDVSNESAWRAKRFTDSTGKTDFHTDGGTASLVMETDSAAFMADEQEVARMDEDGLTFETGTMSGVLNLGANLAFVVLDDGDVVIKGIG